ncbi:2-oxoglutarate ferredoxin oxidoreductase subunit gamma [candidate division WOR-1 bacterium DG_54_3]|uniref:2-oxoglutarate ferredoxin oxidoreductase subunit gamma n=1 Tax=candidate division WOR-1 bacterium DG_54_3 TaxID=1703775 RepID=A0A0S7XRW3_UNCSA|nr:MAG: 2-oxoglutarate ferredoxin oxidoreductase subunit gamma [candidate division WOR-1 bacterium DG_54_3]
MEKAKKKIETDDRFEIRLSGSGGQGMVFAGMILAEAIGINDGKNVVQTQSYGPEARGGTSRSDVVVSSKDIYYPKPIKLDLLLCLTQESCDTYHQALKEDGLLIVDSDLVSQLPACEVHAFSFTQLARGRIGTPMVANVIALGTIAGLTKIVSKRGLSEAVQRRAPKGTEEKNLKALEMGFELARKKRGKKSH